MGIRKIANTLDKQKKNQICLAVAIISFVLFCFNLVSHGIYLAVLANTLKNHWV